jgi:hypothetical protein
MKDIAVKDKYPRHSELLPSKQRVTTTQSNSYEIASYLAMTGLRYRHCEERSNLIMAEARITIGQGQAQPLHNFKTITSNIYGNN